MLNSYEAIYDNGILQWLGDKPEGNRLYVVVTVVEMKNVSDRIDDETLGLDLDSEAVEQLHKARLDREKGNYDAYIDIDSI
jgi:hypothetical protein